MTRTREEIRLMCGRTTLLGVALALEQDHRSVAADIIRCVADYVAALESDAARLDWLNEHEAQVEVEDTDGCPCTVMSNRDFNTVGSADPYDIRAAIDDARGKA